MTHHLERTAAALVAHGRGILAADETVPTLTKRFNQLGIQSTEHSISFLGADTLSVLGFYHDIPVVKVWNGPLVARDEATRSDSLPISGAGAAA